IGFNDTIWNKSTLKGI
ncbi:unnamed protein product, partial [Rotaria sp. Silwood1]